MDNQKYKINFTDSPQSTLNGFISMSRNIFLTSSIGIALLTFSRNFKDDKTIIRIIALSILLYSILYGLKAVYDFSIYLNYLDKHNDIPFFFKEKINRWYLWILITNIYTIIYIFYKKILN